MSSKFYEYKEDRYNTNFPFFIYRVNSMAEKSAHWHEEFEIIYADSDGIIEIDAELVGYKKHDIVFINKECLHKAVATSDGIMYALVFKYDFLDFKHDDICQTQILDNLKHGKSNFPALIGRDSIVYTEISKCVLEIIDLYSGHKPGRELKIKCRLYEIIFLCYGHGLFNSVPVSKTGSQHYIIKYVKSAISYMEKNLTSAITVGDMAKYIGINKYYLIKIFKKVTGVTPIIYLRSIKIEHSAILLKDGVPIMQAALMSGFNSVSYYIKTFKGIYDITPKEFVHGLKSKNHPEKNNCPPNESILSPLSRHKL